MVFFDVCVGFSLIDLGALIYLIVAPYTARRGSFVHFYFWVFMFRRTKSFSDRLAQFPTTAALMAKHEEMLAAQERAIIEQSNAKARAMVGLIFWSTSPRA